MADTMPDIKDVLDKTGMSNYEMAALCGVTPPVIYSWVKGGAAHKLRLPKLNKLVSTLLAIADEGALPLSDGGRSEDRVLKIKGLLLKQLQKTS